MKAALPGKSFALGSLMAAAAQGWMLGRYLTATSGTYVVRVRYVKESMGEKFAVADGGTNHHMAAVVETEPGFAGDTQSGARKPATTETGLVVTVPIFVEIGDVIRIDTRTGDYQTRV